MKMHIPIPEGLELPEDASTKPFKLNGMFIVMDDKLMPVEIGGYPVSSGKEEEMSEEEDMGEEDSYGEEDSCEHTGGSGMCEECSQKGGKGGMDSFIIAIERALAKPKK
jgi:hypothetical protein